MYLVRFDNIERRDDFCSTGHGLLIRTNWDVFVMDLIDNSSIFFRCFDMNQNFYSGFYFFYLSYEIKDKARMLPYKGRSKTTLARFWLFLTTYPPVLTFSMVWTLTNSGHFWTTYLPRLVNVVCEQPCALKVRPYFLSRLYFILSKVKLARETAKLNR